MEFWTEVRRQVLVECLSKRGAVKKYNIRWHTLDKILSLEEPPGYQQKQARPKPKIEAFLLVIAEILKADQKAPRKQRQSAKRIFECLRDEHEFTGGYQRLQGWSLQWLTRIKHLYHRKRYQENCQSKERRFDSCGASPPAFP